MRVPCCSESDPRVGGRYRLRFRMLDGSEHETSGEFLEIVRPERVVMSWRWKGGLEDPGESRVEIRLKAIPEGTELTFTHAQLHNEETRRSHEEGWTGALDKLEALFLRNPDIVKLYYSDILSARRACAVAQYLHAPVEYVYLDFAKL